MYFYLAVYLTLSTWGRLVLSAPLPETEIMKVMKSYEFQDALGSALSLVTKIHNEIPAVHKSMISITKLKNLDASDMSELQLLKKDLNLPKPSPLHPISETFTLDVSLGHIADGLKLHKVLLEVIEESMHFKSKKSSDLRYELRDALRYLHEMERLIKAEAKSENVVKKQLQDDLERKLAEEYPSQVAAHLALIQLRDFSKDAKRSLQSMIVEPESQES